ncbi:MAG: NAD(P)/FAD-dependent oxidoreductase [Ignavibacteriae bacterium]|nr:NAD(P)/FAD-dependent oxidoreductase [Ignavibacteriota bacterium]
MEKVDITIIGAGVVGLAIAAYVSDKSRNVLVVEKHKSFGQETSSRNSEVIHASIYYPKNSLKGKLCLEGNEMLCELCHKYNIPHKNTGKLIVACNDEEVAKLPILLNTAMNNGAKGVHIISQDEVKKMEPNVEARAAIYCPTSGIVDSHSLMRHYEAMAIENGANAIYGIEVVSIDKASGGYIVGYKDRSEVRGKFQSRILINCAGLESGKISEMAGINQDEAGYRIQRCKGIYFRVRHGIEKFPKMLIYPVPPVHGHVGVHTTPDLGGGMRLGPHFYWTDEMDLNVDESYREYFYESAVRFLPFLKIEDLQPDIAGFYPTRQKPGEGLIDFIIKHESERGLDNFINLVGIESPGLTASPAIGKYVKELIDNSIYLL